MEGLVKWFDENKGFGFIDFNGCEYFVHRSSITNQVTLKSGQKVQFNIIKGVKGLMAGNVIVFEEHATHKDLKASQSFIHSQHKRLTCYQCGECGHVARDCPLLKKYL